MASQNSITRSKIEKILAHYPDRIPVVVRPENSDKFHRFLVSGESILSEFIILLRNKIKLDKTQGIYIFVNSGKEAILPPTSSKLGTIYKDHHDENLVLNLIYAKENVFG